MYFYFLPSLQQVFISQYIDQQGIKTRFQCEKDIKEVSKAFSNGKMSDNDFFATISEYDIFKYKIGDELIASVYLKRSKYHSLYYKFLKPCIREEDAVEIYSLYVNKKYRGKKYSRILLYNALTQIKNHYNFKNDFIIGLHLNPEDPCMNISFTLYYSMGFNRGTFCNYGPSEFQHKFDMYNSFHNPLNIIQNPLICKNTGSYLALFTRFNRFNPFRSIQSQRLLMFGEKLRDILKSRRKTKK